MSVVTGERIAYRLSELAPMLGMSKRTLMRYKARGALPEPDLRLGRCLYFTPETLRAWLAGEKPAVNGRNAR